ncbi:MAG: hypothetical protein KGV44_08030 [Flavobacteriaceae bacterium]|nr:hypothetical protein [Flavobacteriaceae bacterium]
MIYLAQQINIEEKLKNAPDSSYEIGVFIGSFLPVVLLVILAYFLFNKMKNRKDLNE